jgi:hypothetical protein
MEDLTSEMERLQWLRDKVQELSSKGHSLRGIAKTLQVGLGSVNRDLTYIRQQTKNNIKKYIDEGLPEEYEKCMVGLNPILREAWITSQQTEDRRERMRRSSFSHQRPPRLSPGPICALMVVQLPMYKAKIFHERSAS